MALLLRLRPLSSAKVTVALSVMALVVSAVAAGFFPDQGAFQFGLLLCWTGFCIAAVVADRMILWAVLCLSPFTVIALFYLADLRMAQDPFGLRLALTQAFLFVSLITAGTGVFSIVRTAAAVRH